MIGEMRIDSSFEFIRLTSINSGKMITLEVYRNTASTCSITPPNVRTVCDIGVSTCIWHRINIRRNYEYVSLIQIKNS